MANQLKDIDITFISLVRKGANKKTIIFKSDEGEDLKEVSIKKFDDEKGIVYGIVYAPDEVDAHGDFAKAEDIEKASQNFMRNLSVHNIDKQHSFNKEDAFVAENWIVEKGNDKIFPEEPTGAWAVGIKIEDEALKKEIKSGDITGISMAGIAKRYVQKEEDGLLDKIKQLFKKEITMDEKKIQELIDDSIKKAMEKIPVQKTDEESATLFKSVIDNLNIVSDLTALKEEVQKISKETSGSVQTEDEDTKIAKQDEEGNKIAEIIKKMQGEG